MEKLWLNNYPSGVPEHIDVSDTASLVEFFERACQRYAELPAYQNFGTQLSYQDLDKKSRAFAAYLQQTLELKKGDRVAIMSPNLMQYPIVLFGILRAGLVVVNTNPLYTATELTHQLNDSGAKAIVVLTNFAHTVEKALPKLSALKHVITTELGDMLPPVKRFIVNSVVKYIKKMVPTYKLAQAVPLLKTLKQGEKLAYTRVKLQQNDIAFLQYTGGTTGVAKGAILTHKNMLSNVEQAGGWVANYLEPGREIIVTALPLYHIFSLTANCLTFLKYGALNILITNPRDLDQFIKDIKHSRFTAITGVNTLFNALNNHPEFAKVDFSHLKFALSGGMSLQESVATSWESITGTAVLEAFGLTETSPAVCINPYGSGKFTGSIGLPLSSTDIKICDDNGQEVAIGEEGELLIRGPQVMQGYWQQQKATDNVLSKDGWLRTGDIAKVDDGGFVFLVDRKKDMIIVSGFNVYPNEIENVISAHPGVLEVGVIGVPYKDTGERVKAYIVKKDPELTQESIIGYCKEHLTAYKVPKYIEFFEELPKTNVGKILRRALKDSNDASRKSSSKTS